MGRRSSKSRASLSYNATLVLHSISQGIGYGFDIMRVTDLPSGTVYPSLRRLEAAGLVVSRWEEQEESAGEGRPRRRYYEATGQGEAALAVSLERIRARRHLLGEVVGHDPSAPAPE